MVRPISRAEVRFVRRWQTATQTPPIPEPPDRTRTNKMINYEEIAAAVTRIDGHAIRTPLMISDPMSERIGATVAIKAEHRQRTGSFKLRGALNKVFGLSQAEANSGVVTASSGNHGIGVATAAAARGIPCTVYLPSGASSSKVSAIKRLGAAINTVDGTDTVIAEAEARAASARDGVSYISPYNDPGVIAGQGTIGVEIIEDAPAAGLATVDAVIVAVGGGGLISGIASAVKHHLPQAIIVGASAANDKAMAASVAAGKLIEPPALPTFSDGTAGAVEAGAITFELCQSLVDQWLAVDETAIASAVTAMIDDHHELVEGAAGVALAAACEFGRSNRGANIAVISCGANASAAAVNNMLRVGLEAAETEQP